MTVPNILLTLLPQHHRKWPTTFYQSCFGHKQVRPPSSKCKCATNSLKREEQTRKGGGGVIVGNQNRVCGMDSALRHATAIKVSILPLAN